MTSKGFDWNEYLDVASHLLNQAGEGYHRSAVSRAYYAAFCSSRDYLEGQGPASFGRANIHRAVIDGLKQSSEPPLRKAGRDLDNLRRERNLADYSAMASITENRARKSLRWASKIIKGIRIA